MFGAILKATNSSFQKGMTFCRSIYVKKVMKLLAFIFEQPSYINSVPKSVRRLCVHVCVHPSKTFVVNASPPKPLDVATANFAVA